MVEEDKKLHSSGAATHKRKPKDKKTPRKPDWRIVGMVVVPIVVALIGLTPTLVDLIRAQKTPSSSGPNVYGFSACAQPCNGSNGATVFEERIGKIYTQWNYRNIPVGASYVRTWSMNGKEWIRYSCTWPGPTDGKDVINLTEPKGLSSGVWEMTIAINGTVISREKIQIQGTFKYWDPVGTVDSCYGG